MLFSELGLSANLLRAIDEQGYVTPTPIQQAAIPSVLNGVDVVASAQTGTGKTAGFTLPILHHLSENPVTLGHAPVRALILTPTRELAAQIGQNIEDYGRYTSIRSAVIYGGVKINPQIARLREGVDVLVATPGRLLDHVSQGTLSLDAIEMLVLDEADRMLDMGFIHDIRKILALLPEKSARQNLLFSATFSKEIKQLANKLMNNPQLVEVASSNATADKIDQAVYHVEKSRKRALLSHLIKSEQWDQVLVFTRTKHGANRLAQQLSKDGLTAAAIHGNKSQAARTRALAGFKDGDVHVLVATDIAARGLDIDQLPHVVNYELPNVPEDYVHRIGRTARAGHSGQAVSLIEPEEAKLLKPIERLLKRTLPVLSLPEFRAVVDTDANRERNAEHRSDRSTQGKKSSSKTGNRRSRQARSSSGHGGKSANTSPATNHGNGNSADKKPGNSSGNSAENSTGNPSRRRKKRRGAPRDKSAAA
ncbi:MAG: DEAD/DEAH box helicase [Granulosicoccus sp.]|nr:DEAD/DEAH box helicase [Granulosicoccus sp.]